MKRFIQIFILCFTFTALSGCLLAVAGAGLGGGYYFAKNYKVEKKKSTPSKEKKLTS